MSKKSKRRARKVTQKTLVEPTTSSASTPSQASFSPDYSYVSKDLGRVGILVGSEVVLLIVLTFFLH